MSRAGHAIVMGGSMAGLLAARVLADFFERVTLIERDAPPDAPETRQGVPQGRHAHALLARGEQILSGLFPGLTNSTCWIRRLCCFARRPSGECSRQIGWGDCPCR